MLVVYIVGNRSGGRAATQRVKLNERMYGYMSAGIERLNLAFNLKKQEGYTVDIGLNLNSSKVQGLVIRA